MKISRQIGTTNQMVDLYVMDATVTTGRGLTNIEISSFSTYWIRNDMASTSSVVMNSTGSLSTYSSGRFLQINSTFMAGWYRFGLPNAVLAAGDSAAVHMYGHPSMVILPIEIELTRTDNQTYVSAQPHNVTRVYSSALVTSQAGVVATDWDLGRVLNSTSTVILSSFQVSAVSVSVSGVNVTSVRGTPLVTSQAGVIATDWDLSRILNSTSTVTLANFNISTAPSLHVSTIIGQMSTADISSVRFSVSSVLAPISVGGVNVTSIRGSAAVTTAAGVLAAGPVGVSSMAIGVRVTTFNSRVGVSSINIPVGVSSITPAVRVTSIAVDSGYLDVNITSVAGDFITGTGTSSDPWGP